MSMCLWKRILIQEWCYLINFIHAHLNVVVINSTKATSTTITMATTVTSTITTSTCAATANKSFYYQ